jgi:hypothetical protein
MASTGGGALLMLCRICGKKGDHWTSRCPYKDLSPQAEVLLTGLLLLTAVQHHLVSEHIFLQTRKKVLIQV